MDIVVRKLANDDNPSQVAKLIYETDNYIFPHFFGKNTAIAKQILVNMINADTIYNRDNICIATLDGEIIGISVVSPSPIKINVSAFFEAFEQAGADAEIDEAFESVMKEYFLPMETHPDGYYIACLCVEEQYRGKGVAGAMLDFILGKEYVEKDIYLDCLADNNVAIAVYEAHGFCKLFEFSGFTGLEYYKMIKKTERSIEE